MLSDPEVIEFLQKTKEYENGLTEDQLDAIKNKTAGGPNYCTAWRVLMWRESGITIPKIVQVTW